MADILLCMMRALKTSLAGHKARPGYKMHVQFCIWCFDAWKKGDQDNFNACLLTSSYLYLMKCACLETAADIFLPFFFVCFSMFVQHRWRQCQSGLQQSHRTMYLHLEQSDRTDVLIVCGTCIH